VLSQAKGEMHPGALLALTAELVESVLKLEGPADGVAAAFFRRHRNLGPRERRVLAETAFEVLRRRLRWEHAAQGGPGPKARRLALLAWQGDAELIGGALDAQEQAWRAQARAADPAALPEAARHELPPWLAAALRAQLGDAELEPLAAALLAPAPLDLRVNALKARRDELRASLRAAGLDAEPTPYSPWGLRLRGKPAIQRLPAFTGGQVEIQDEGSQLLALLTGAPRGEVVVDFCAGGGGKTLALGAMMRNTGRLYALDTAAHRLEALKPRMARAGLGNVHPMAIVHERDERLARLAGKADRVLVDAPCSGLGTLRRNPDLKWRQTPQSVADLRARQAAILAEAARLVRGGGRLVFATCSLLREEGEDVALGFEAAHATVFERLEAGPVLRAAGAEAAIETPEGFLRLWPHRHGTDGFFAAAWKRR
jgi:16S rRNA (cytosine967-C5)-methyltransferase